MISCEILQQTISSTVMVKSKQPKSVTGHGVEKKSYDSGIKSKKKKKIRWIE